MSLQQGDISLLQTNNDADIDINNGIVTMSSGLETSVYLSLFGGAEKDDGSKNNIFNWWGNVNEITNKQYHSKTQYLLQLLPLTSNNLPRIEDAVKIDLAWMIEAKIASSISIVVTIPSVNIINISISIQVKGEEINFNFTENWKANYVNI